MAIWLGVGLLLGACDDAPQTVADQGRPVDGGTLLDAEVDAMLVDAAGGQGGQGGSGGIGGAGAQGGGGEGGVVLRLQLQPDDVVLPLTEPPPSVQFTLLDQGEAVPGEAVQWIAAPDHLGAIDVSGRFTAAGLAGVVTVLAEYEGASTTARVELQAVDDVVVEGTPPETVGRIDGAPEAGVGCAPLWLYPQANTVIPGNMMGLRMMWDRRGHDAFRVSIALEGTVIRWFTTDNWIQPEGQAWLTLMGRAGGHTMQITLTGVGGAGEDACSAMPHPIRVDRSRLQGAVYYWSTSDVGIMRLAVGETAPEPLLTPAVAPQINCPACHALSRDGTRIAFTRTTFPPFGDLATSLVDAPADLLYDPTGVVGYFPSFAPDNQRLVAGSGGDLVVRNSDTGEALNRLPLPEDSVAGSADWSWRDDQIVATLGGPENILPDVGVTGAIYKWQAVDGVWMDPEPLVQPINGQSLDRPAFSPDSTLVAFNTVGDSGGGGMGNANVDLWIVPATGGDPVRLAEANNGNGQGNAWPKWSPTDRRGRMWLAFSSLRDYGDQLCNTCMGDDSKRPQIWVTAIDPTAEDGIDPSAPAFWLPYQSINSGNHIPYWAAYNKE
jgi:hypothetical protein